MLSKPISVISVLLWCYCASSYGQLSAIPEIVKTKIEPPAIDAKSWMLVHYDTDWILASKQADLQIEPASLTKLMTGYLVFAALERQEITMQDTAYVSKKAWQTGGSKMFIQVDTQVSIVDLLHGLIIQSGNDAAVALAEHLGGNEAVFAEQMNAVAHQLGMTNTRFANSSGLPATDHYSTVRDMTILAIALIRRFPQFYPIYSQPEFTYNHITQQNRNLLLARDANVDGIKTGYTKKAGYCLIGTTLRDGVRMIATVTGAKSEIDRANEVQRLLRYSEQVYTSKLLYQSGDTVQSIPLWFGQSETAHVGVEENLAIVIPRGREPLTYIMDLPPNLEAPLTAGHTVGKLTVHYDDQPIHQRALLVNKDYARGGWFTRVFDHIGRFFSW